MSEVQQSTAVIPVYGCGGLGINVASVYNGDVQAVGSATLHPFYVDTSDSNIRSSFNSSDIFLIEGLNGSGKLRSANADAIRQYCKQILQNLPPQQDNILVYSFSGGSGSVLGPILAREIASRGLNVFIVAAGSEESLLTAENTLATLKTQQGISRSLEQTITAYYDHNTQNRTRAQVDESLRQAIASIAFLCSGTNSELDGQDLINWSHPERVSGNPPQFALLDIYKKQSDMGNVTDPISIASLYANPDLPPLTIVPDYHCAGYTYAEDGPFRELHFVISTTGLPALIARVSKVVVDLKKRTEARVTQPSILGRGDNVADDGLVL